MPDACIRVMLVDDHPMVREGLKARFASVERLEVVAEAATPDEALVALDCARPEVVVMDIGLKEGNGIELLRLFRARQAGVRVLMYSMYDTAEVAAQALQAGAWGYVPKDAPAQEIIDAILAVASGTHHVSAAVSHRLRRAGAGQPMLSPRESEILAGLGRGESSKLIARALGLSVRTVETHRQNIKRKLNVDGQAELIKVAVEYAQRHRVP